MDDIKSSDNNVQDNKRDNIILLLASIFVGIIFNYLFYGKFIGVSYPIFALVFYGIFLWNVRDKLIMRITFGWLLLIPILLLSFTFFIFSNEVLFVLNFLMLPFLIVVQTMLITKGNKYDWFCPRFLEDILRGVFINTFQHIGKPFAVIKGFIPSGKKEKQYPVLFKVLIGLACSVPLLIIVIPLLASADTVFADVLNKLPNIFEMINFSSIYYQTFLVVFITFVFFSYTYSSIHPEVMNRNNKSGSQTTASDNSTKRTGILDPVIVITMLVVTSGIYLLFVAIQFKYLFGGIVPNGLSFAEYARKGFFELVAVTIINLGLLLFNIEYTRDAGSYTTLARKILNMLILFSTGVMLVSAMYRMFMYEEAFGYTYLRVFTQAFMVFIFIILMVTLYKIINRNLAALKYYIIIALVSYVIVNFINVDLIIAKGNIQLYKNKQKVDVHYLTELSYDAVPYMLELHQLLINKDDVKRRQVENALYAKKKMLDKEKSWQSFNISEYRAKLKLAGEKFNYKEVRESPDKDRVYDD